MFVKEHSKWIMKDLIRRALTQHNYLKGYCKIQFDTKTFQKIAIV